MFHFFIKRKRFFFFFFLIILCISLITFDVEKNQKHSPAEKALQRLFSYPLNLTSQSINTIKNIWTGYIYLINVEANNSELQQKINMLTLENQQLQEYFIENQRLKALLDFKQQFSYHMLAAEIIGRDPSSWFKTILVNRGTEAGVTRGNGVISPQGIVGRVIETTRHSSKVLLITDQNSAVDIIVKRSRARGMLVGFSETSCTVNYVVKTKDILRGDEIIASGLNAIYPRGILVGNVIDARNDRDGFFKHIEVVPAVDFSKLNEVLIVLKKHANDEN